ncbi:hypothetical protein SD70_02730 [Gordoniibacillus kamchatkensis]|uniref:7TM-DISM receptor extracellular domain-containing protein n=1 Tax=Gordoniibacillus kamchatkensis TaxID=1590651 RepID=A0ABR5AML9_9BACL|nr:7TM-DISM domain-containing protein [Paenibacillus sp. VKM B-2647]KIL42113.1 hypothetical protein SD70_02730 [Paenibacillus sp. VKM B-2647]
MRKARIWLPIFCLIAVAFVLIGLFAGVPPTRESPHALRGELDLRGWRFEQGGIVRLAGEWDWGWRRLLTPEQLGAAAAAGELGTIRLPSSWNGASGDRWQPAQGYATFRLRIRWNDPPRLLALRVKEADTSYRLWVDGVQLGGLGQVGTSRASSAPYVGPRTYLFPAQPDGAEIVIQAANFEHRLGGLWEPLELGTPEQIEGAHERRLALDMALFGGLFMTAVYHLALFAMRRRDRSALYFGAFCLIMAVRTTLVGELFFDRLFPQISWACRLRCEYLGAFAGLPLFALFIRELYPREMSVWAVRLITAAGLAYTAVMMATPPSVFTRTIPSYQAVIVIAAAYFIWVLLRAVRRGRAGALLSSIGALIYGVAVVNDIMYFNVYIRTGSYAPLGFTVFIMLHSAALSLKFSRALASEDR